jgi:hypothetical protein
MKKAAATLAAAFFIALAEMHNPGRQRYERL